MESAIFASEVNGICAKEENISLFERPIHWFPCFVLPHDLSEKRNSRSCSTIRLAPATTALAFLDQARPLLSAWTKTIFDFGETAWREYESAAWYVDLLKREGFSVEEGSGGMPTAFCAHWSNGAGPTVGMYAEYDAVPGNCQDAATVKRPRPGLNEHAGGHTDPHSGLGISSLGGLLAAKAAMEHHGISGTLRFTGEPAEKVRGLEADPRGEGLL